MMNILILSITIFLMFISFLVLWRFYHLLAIVNDNISEKYVLITGCDSGFGKSLAISLDSEGKRVIATSLNVESQLFLEQKLSSRSKSFQMDVSLHDSIISVFHQVKKLMQDNASLWAIVNNAGIMDRVGPADWLTVDDYRRHLEINTLGTIDVSLTFLPFIKSSKGRIINMVSILGRVALDFCGPYTTSKFATMGFTDGLRREMYRYGISVCTIEPGFHKTDLTNYSRIRTILDGTWDQCTCKEESYGNDPRASKSYLLNLMKSGMFLFGNESHDCVLSAYKHALFSKFPKTRYYVGRDAKFIFPLLSFLPDFITDPLLNCVKKVFTRWHVG